MSSLVTDFLSVCKYCSSSLSFSSFQCLVHPVYSAGWTNICSGTPHSSTAWSESGFRRNISGRQTFSSAICESSRCSEFFWRGVEARLAEIWVKPVRHHGINEAVDEWHTTQSWTWIRDIHGLDWIESGKMDPCPTLLQRLHFFEST